MKRNKYGAVKTEVDGIKFDSKAEAKRYKELKLLEKVGNITGLELQKRYDFIINGVNCGFYKADFVYVTRLACDGAESYGQTVEDVKGMKTPVYRLKKKLMKAIHGIDILETK